MIHRFRRLSLLSLVVASIVALPATAATPPSGSVSDCGDSTAWVGGPGLTPNPNACNGPSDPTCDNFLLTINAPTSCSDFVVLIEMDSSSTPPLNEQDDFDLYVYDPNEVQAGSSTSAGSFERVALVNPAPGVYRVEVQPWAVSPASTYAASAAVLDNQPPPLIGVAPGPGDTTEFSTPVLMDSQLHTGEPSIAVSPVIPTSGDRPLIIGDAPWGTSNATSLWWRSRDGGESFELVQDPLAAPRPRPCEEIDGGGDSDTAFDPLGNIYVNDLAALINITVGDSQDDFQTMSCSKAGGSTPLQPIQDRQWIGGHPDSDCEGPNIDGYLSFRRGLIDGNPLTETAIQLYTTSDCGASYDFAGELLDVFGFSNGKVSQTGNSVVDWSDGPRRGFYYQSYYLANTAKIGRYDAVNNLWESFDVAIRLSDVGNVFTTLAIDTEGNLYYAWVEGGSFDVIFTTSTDGGETWAAPARLNLPGPSELAVNPFMIAGSPGRVSVLYNATTDAPSPDGATDNDWHLYVAQSINALDASPTFTQYQVTDTPLHFDEICTGGLGCNLSVPERDRSLLEFNEVDVDHSDGSMVFIFADNGRLAQPPLDVAGEEIPQPYIMFTRQIAGNSMIAGKTIQNTLPRVDAAADALGDATYPKAGTTEGPNHPALDILGSRLEETATGVKAVVHVDALDFAAGLDPLYGTGDPRLTQKASWITRFEVRHEVPDGGGGTEVVEEVYALGAEYDRTTGGPTWWYGPVDVARNALLDVKRSHYGPGPGTITTGDTACNTLSVEIPFSAMGLDLVTDPDPVFHSVTTFALAQPENELDGMQVASYFNNQRTVDASGAYDWTLGGPGGTASTADAGPDKGALAGESVAFDGTGSTLGDAGRISCYEWDFGDGFTGAGATVDHTYAAPGVYTVTLTITDSLGFVSTDTATVVVTTPGCTSSTSLHQAFFEGGFGEWDVIRDPLGHLDTTAAAALEGSLGMAVTLDHDPPASEDREHWVTASHAATSNYCWQFWFDPNSLDMPDNRVMKIFGARATDNQRLLDLALRKQPPGGDPYAIGLKVWVDSLSNAKKLPFAPIGDGPVLIGGEWSTTAEGGILRLYINGVLAGELTGVTNVTRELSRVGLGNLGLFRPVTQGVLFFDAFTSGSTP